MEQKHIRKNHSHKNYTVYYSAGYFMCEECGNEIHYSKLGLKLKDLVQYYDDYKDMMQYVIVKDSLK